VHGGQAGESIAVFHLGNSLSSSSRLGWLPYSQSSKAS
jgi:hypothetical protein